LKSYIQYTKQKQGQVFNLPLLVYNLPLPDKTALPFYSFADGY